MTSVFDYQNSQKLLTDTLQSFPKKGWGISRKLSQHLGVNTSLVSLVLTGRQSFSPEQAYRVADFFGWKRLEKKYFLSLIQAERAGHEDLKKFYFDEMAQIKKEALKLSTRLEEHKTMTEEQRTLFYSSAMYTTLRLFCSLGEKGKTLDEIQEQFELPLSELRPMLDFLLQAGLLRLEKSIYHLGHAHTHLEQGSVHLLKHHTNWRLRAIEKAERLSNEDLMFTGPLSMSHADFLKIREDIVQLIKRAIEIMKPSPSEMVVCLNIDWIKIIE
jgi:uncharacterized protein (TIGR02147 family)